MRTPGEAEKQQRQMGFYWVREGGSIEATGDLETQGHRKRQRTANFGIRTRLASIFMKKF